MVYLSLNGNFDYPVEIKQTLTVDKKAKFNDAIQQGIDNGNAAQYSFVTGNSCVADAPYSFSAGRSSYTGPGEGAQYSRADGFQCSGYGEYSRALGCNSKTNAKDRFSFVWQGNESAGEYESKGVGTFCINPQNSINGFFIGASSITDYISSHSALRILENPNVFTAPQEFCNNVVFSGPVTAYSQCVYSKNAPVSFNGDVSFDGEGTTYLNGGTFVGQNNEIDSPISSSVASITYARGIALSAITNLGEYFPITSIDSIDFDEKRNFAVSLDFLRTYVTSSINNPEIFYDSNPPSGKSVATRDYSEECAINASTRILPLDNVFTGTNTFSSIKLVGNNSLLYLESPAVSADFRRGTVLINEPASISNTFANTPATERFVRNVATSGVNSILNSGNTYGSSSRDTNTYVAKSDFNGDASFRGAVSFYSTISLDSNAVANFAKGTLYVKEPSTNSMLEREPSTTWFTRKTALSAVSTLLSGGGTFSDNSTVTFNGKTVFNNFNSTVTFNTSPIFNKSLNLSSVEVDVKTQNLNEKCSTRAASTKYVENYITNTISTSAVSVKKLILNGNDSSKRNNFTTTNDFRGGSILVNTVADEDADKDEYKNYAASCEFVKSKFSSINMFDIFEMKYMDYVLNPTDSKWKMSGTIVTKKECPNAYNHILKDLETAERKEETIGQIQIKYFSAKDGHKIVLSDFIETLKRLFNETGIAWYYIINTRSEQIWLPRSKYNFNISTSDVGRYIPPSLPPHTHELNLRFSQSSSSGKYPNHGGSSPCNHDTGDLKTGGALWKGNTIGEGNTVQPPATKMYLYFYCG